MKRFCTVIVLVLTATLAFGQTLDQDFAKLTARPTFGGKYEPDNTNIQIARRGISAMSVKTLAVIAPTVNLGKVTPSNPPQQYVLPLSLSNADGVVSVRVAVDQNQNFAAVSESLQGNIIQTSDREYNLTNIGKTGEHDVLVTLAMRDGTVIRYPSKYIVPLCPESDIFTLQPQAPDAYMAILQGMVKSPEFVSRVDFVYAEYYDGKDVLAGWDPNTPQPKAVKTAPFPYVKSGLAQSYVQLSDTKFRGYGFVGWYAMVVTTNCGTRLKSDIRDFTTRMQAQVQAPVRTAAVDLKLRYNSSSHVYVLTATVDALDKPARIFIHGSGAGIVPSCYFYWQNWEHFIGGPVYFIWPWDGKGLHTFETTIPDWFFWKGAHYTMIVSVFVETGAKDASGNYEYLYDQAEVQIEGSAPPPDWIPTDCWGGRG